ncbi:unnamed protein product [Umbelopsis vinacea]
MSQYPMDVQDRNLEAISIEAATASILPEALDGLPLNAARAPDFNIPREVVPESAITTKRNSEPASSNLNAPSSQHNRLPSPTNLKPTTASQRNRVPSPSNLNTASDGSNSPSNVRDGTLPINSTYVSKIHDAVNRGGYRSGISNVERSISPEEPNEDGTNAIHTVAANGQLQLLTILLNHGPYIDSRDHQGSTALHHAAARNQIDAVILLLDRSANVNSSDDYKFTALHQAAKHGHLKIVSPLLERGAMVDARDARDFCPLHYAALTGQTSATAFLLKKGAVINSNGYELSTALHSAAGNNHIEAVTLLLDQGADLTAKNAREYSPLYFSATYGYSEIVTLLLDRCANTEDQRVEGMSSLLCAATTDQCQVIRVLKRRNADLNFVDGQNYNALHLAALKGYPDAIALLLDMGFDIEKRQSMDRLYI